MKILESIICLLIIIQFSNLSFAQNAPQSNKEFVIEELTIDSLHDAIKNNKITCEQLIDLYIERIKQYNLSTDNHAAPFNALTEINLTAKEQAKHLDDRYSQSHQLIGPLHCVPLVIKDNINTYDAMTTSGSFALLGTQPVSDAFLVSRLRDAGAIVLAKSGMDELASGMKGISSRSGRIGNAYNPEKNPGGSSGGSAVAVSANFALAGIGTDNSGSIRIPAAFNGLVGLRPSVGLISQRGIFPAGNLDGTAGPLTRNVKDLAILLDVIAREDHLDKKTLKIQRIKTYTDYLNENGLQGKHIGIVRYVDQFDIFKNMPNDVLAQFKKSFKKMQEAGAVITYGIDLPQFDNNRKLNMAGMREEVNDYLASFPAARKNFEDICKSDRTRVFGSKDECLRFINTMPKKISREYSNALKIFTKNKMYVEKIMNEHHLDALLMPISTTGNATYDEMKVNTWQVPVSSNAGLPSITINIGYKDGMPVGAELIGKQFAEGTLIELAYAYEKHFTKRLVPTIPVFNKDISNLSIPQLNNLFTLLGSNAYQDVLKKGRQEDLTADRFRKITIDTIKRFKSENKRSS